MTAKDLEGRKDGVWQVVKGCLINLFHVLIAISEAVV